MTRIAIPHAGNIYGGTERALETLAQCHRWSVALQSRFVLCFDGQMARTLAQLGARTDVIGAVRLSRPHQVLRARRRFRGILEQDRPDAVFTQSEWSHLVFAPVAKRLNLPVVLWAHDAASGGKWITGLAARHRPDWIICNSQYTQRAIREHFPGVPTNVVYYPIPFDDRFAETRADIRARIGATLDAPVIINVARMDPYKGQRHLIDALALLDRSIPWECWFVGGPQRPAEYEYERSLREAVERLHLSDRVRFLGQQADARTLLAAADICCHPNQAAEAFGLSIVEGMQAGLPVVASSIGGPAEIVTPECGRLAPPADARGIASALQELLDDPQLRAQMGDAARARAWDLCNPERRLTEMASTLSALLQHRAAA